MTKEKLREKLRAGKTLYDIFPFREGQECEIYKADLYRMNDVIYVPDLTVHIGMLADPRERFRRRPRSLLHRAGYSR